MQRLAKLTWIGGAFLFDEEAEANVRITATRRFSCDRSRPTEPARERSSVRPRSTCRGVYR